MISVVYLSVLWRYLMSKRKNFAEKASKTLHKQYDFSTTEIWNADHAIVNFSYQILKKYKKSKRHGYPAEFKNPEEWEKVLDRILKAFKRTLNDYADSPMNKAYDKLYKKHPECLEFKFIKQKDGNYLMKNKHEDLHDKYITDEVREKEKTYNQEIEEAMKLFGKYLLNMWD